MANMARISQRSRKIAAEIGHATGKKQIEIIEQALLVYRRHWRLSRLAEDFDRLREDSAEWESYTKETEELDGTIGDGLEDE